jgi:hypothetical protein
MKTPKRNQIHEGPKPDAVTLHFLGQKSAKPLWVVEDISTSSPRYQAIKALKLSVTQMAIDETGTKPPLYYVYLRTDEQAYKVYQILGVWPSIYSARVKIIKFMEENSVNLLP